MSQYRTGLVSVENGSATVIGDTTAWLYEVAVGDLLTIRGTGATYTVAGVVSDTELTLTAPYGGITASGVNYIIARNFTPNADIPLIAAGDIETATIVSEAFKRIDDMAWPVTSVSSPVGGQALIYDDEAEQFTNQPVVNSLTGTTNQIAVSQSTGHVTLSLPSTVYTENFTAYGSLTGVNATLSGTVSVTGQLDLTASYPEFRWIKPDGATDAKKWFMGVNGNTWQLMAYDDAATLWKSIVAADRTGAVIDDIYIGNWSDYPTIWLVGNVDIESSLYVAGTINGDGSALTALNASNLTSGTVPSGRLSGTYGISVSGNAATATTASNSTNLGGQAASYYTNASNLSSGTVPSGRLSGTYAISVSGSAASVGSGNVFPNNAWINSAEGTGRLYFSTSSNTYIGSQSSWVFQAQPGGTNVLTIASDGSLSANGSLSFAGLLNGNGKQVINTGDAWLRLNPNGDFTNGIYTPSRFRIDGGVWTDPAVAGLSYAGLLVLGGGTDTNWTGIKFNDASATLMWGRDAGSARKYGAYHPTYGWEWRFDNGTLVVGTVPYARLSGVGTAATYNASSGPTTSNLVPLTNAYGGLVLNYSQFQNGFSENPSIGQMLVSNGSDYYARWASLTHVGNSLRAANSAGGARRLTRRDWDGNDYNVQTHWTGSHWFLRGYDPSDNFHAECRVGYADTAGSASTATSATYSTYLWSTSHPGSYYISNAWDGTYWQLTSNHGAGIRVSYADNAGALAGYSPSTSATANTVALRDGNGYLFAAYLNQSSGNNENPTISQVFVNNGSDGYLRKASVAHLANALNLGCIVCYQTTTGTTGGGSGGTSYTQRSMNTTQSNTISGASLSSGYIVLPAGTYRARISTTFFGGSSTSLRIHRSRFHNATDNSTIALSNNVFLRGSDGRNNVNADMFCQFTLSGTKSMSIDSIGDASYTDAWGTTDGNSNFGGSPNIWAQAFIEKVG